MAPAMATETHSSALDSKWMEVQSELQKVLGIDGGALRPMSIDDVVSKLNPDSKDQAAVVSAKKAQTIIRTTLTVIQNFGAPNIDHAHQTDG